MKQYIKVILICVLIFLAYLFIRYMYSHHYTSSIITDTKSVTWSGAQELESEKIETGTIAIPGTTKLILGANRLSQKVNIYNPAENSCLMVFTLFANGKVLWKSGYCKPGDGYYEIELSKELTAGTYDGSILHECYDLNGNKLNSANVQVIIIAQ